MDHQRVSISHSAMSCGVLELSSISDDLNGVLYALASRLYHPARGEPAAFFVWSDIIRASDLFIFAINKGGFGEVSVSCVAENPKTGNQIEVYTWKINHARFKEWYADERVKRIKKVGAN